MHPSYADIRERIADQPQWYDQHGVPRYCTFAPQHCSDIYAPEVALLEIECQACGQRFIVEALRPRIPGASKLSEIVACGDSPSYGDPPRHGNCAGETMSAWTIRVIELWTSHRGDWVRVDGLNAPPVKCTVRA